MAVRSLMPWPAGRQSLGLIGYTDAYGEGRPREKRRPKAKGIKMVAVERYGRTDTSVMGMG